MRFFSLKLAATRRLSSGIISGKCAVLRLFWENLTKSCWDGGKEEAVVFPSPVPVVTISDLARSPFHCGGFGEISEWAHFRPSWVKAVGKVFAVITLLTSLLTLLSATPVSAALTVDNIATASFSIGPLPVVTNSNLVSIVIRTPSTIEFLQYAPLAAAAVPVDVATTSYLSSGGVLTALTWPVPLGSVTPLDLSLPLPLVNTGAYHENEPVFIRLTDLDQNLDPLVAETVLVTLNLADNGDSETLQLTETGPDTGIFTGYIQSVSGAVTTGNGLLSINQDSVIQAHYTDVVDGTDTSAATVMVDPYGIVFDTATGLPVNGTVVTIIDAVTGLPAVVFGDDGISTYPSSVISGSTVSDSSGMVYIFQPGYYRFPFLLPGRYILNVAPPTDYRAPSLVSTVDIQDLPGAPFAIVAPGSRGEEFVLNPGPAIHIDLPVDPLTMGLYLTKTSSKSTVAVGDFLQYKISVENTDLLDATSALINDKLPLGFSYRKGSTRINNIVAVDPTVSADGRTMNFNVGTIAAGNTVTVTYVVVIGGGAKLGKAENTAAAIAAGGISSNIARAGVLVKEDLFHSKSYIVGRVFPEGCGETGQDKEGVAGVRIYLEDGTYVITDKMGMYHFEGVNPGTHVVQLDLETLPEDYLLIACEEHDRFGDTPYSQFVDLQGGTMWRADFYTDQKPEEPPIMINGEVGLELSSVIEKVQSDSNVVKYAVDISVGEVPAGNIRLTVMLPDGTEYQPGSSFLMDSSLPDPEVMENILTYRLGDVESGWAGKVRLNAGLAPDLKDGQLLTRALLTFDTSEAKNRRTPLVDNILEKRTEKAHYTRPDILLLPRFEEFGYSLSKNDRIVLDQIVADLKKLSVLHIFVTGHTNSTRIAPRSRHLMADNYELSEARAKAVADYFAENLGLDQNQITSTGKGSDEPIASNSTAKGRALNRRVALRIISEEVVVESTEFENIKERSGIKGVEITGVKIAEKSAEELAREARIKARTMPEFDHAWLNKVEPGLAMVWPYADFYPAIPSVKIVVKHTPGKKLQLLLNGEEVDPVYLDGTTKRKDNAVSVTLWGGIHVYDGDNLFEVVEYGQDGTEERRLGRNIHYSGFPVKAEMVPEYSRLTADGKTPTVIGVRLTDKDGHPAREGVTGEYSVDPPYQALTRLDDLQNTPLTASKSERLKYVVGEDGIALIKLQPTSKTGEATLRFKLVNGENEVRSWLTPGERGWILIGLAEGTAGYNQVSGNMESLGDSGGNDQYYDDGRLAFFAKGTIKGKWLLTAAYDSAKNGIKQNDSLHGTIDPDQYYTLYGDGSEQQYDAASARSLYLKIERDKFYALFGDFATGLSVTELSKYNRNLNGFKSEMKGSKFDFNIFLSDTNQAFVKDEIRGDGTSGLYQLSRNNIVMNSESIVVEARDRFRSEVVISSRRLSRHLDYDIDYDTGTVFFKSPVSSRDATFNPIYIVVDYESFDQSDLSFNYGGRGAARFLENKLEIGATHIHEGRVGGEGNLVGVDATFKLNDETTVRAEVAATDTDFNGIGAEGTAYLAELSHRADKLEGKAYVREQQSDFGLGQQMGSEAGTRKIGVSGSYRLTEKVNLLGNVNRQYNLSTDGIRDIAESEVRLNEKGYSLHTGFRHAKDKLGTGEVNNSEQLTVGGSFNLLDDSLIIRADHDQSLLNNNQNGDYPTRTSLGADYKLNETATFFVAQEFTHGELEDTETTRIGLRASPWNGGKLSSTLERQYTENGARIFSVTGLQQTWQITKKFSVDGGLDRSDTIRSPGNTPFNTNVPPASGNSTDFTAASVAASYNEEKWSWTGRLEGRAADNEDKVGLFTGFYGEVNEGIGLSAGLQAFKTESEAGLDKTNVNLRFGLAYRPKFSKLIILDRLDFLVDKQKGAALNFDNWRIINNINANYRADNKTQISLQYAAKYVNETIDGNDYGGFTDLIGLEGRYDLTPNWDIGLRGSLLHSWDSDQFNHSTGVSVGHDLVKNLWLSVGYNFTGFTDRDFSSAGFTAQGPFIKLRMKFDQGSVKDAVKMLSGQ